MVPSWMRALELTPVQNSSFEARDTSMFCLLHLADMVGTQTIVHVPLNSMFERSVLCVDKKNLDLYGRQTRPQRGHTYTSFAQSKSVFSYAMTVMDKIEGWEEEKWWSSRFAACMWIVTNAVLERNPRMHT